MLPRVPMGASRPCLTAAGFCKAHHKVREIRVSEVQIVCENEKETLACCRNSRNRHVPLSSALFLLPPSPRRRPKPFSSPSSHFLPVLTTMSTARDRLSATTKCTKKPRQSTTVAVASQPSHVRIDLSAAASYGNPIDDSSV